MSKDAVALLCADLHLCHTPPVARAAEPDWYKAMSRVLGQLRAMARGYPDAVIICAGDLFDRWNVCPELINFALNELPHMATIPGQHDMPHHSFDNMQKSAYTTLVLEGLIEDLTMSRGFCGAGQVEVHGYPWGFDISKDQLDGHYMNVAVIHKYIWKIGQGYPGAPEDSKVGAYRDQLRPYDVAVFGDNHMGFTSRVAGCRVYNCGCLIRRKSNERAYKPSVGVLFDDGSVERVYLDASEDLWVDDVGVGEVESVRGLDEFLVELIGLNEDSLDFRDAMNRFVRDNNVSDGVQDAILDAMGDQVQG